jgi:hypothetical protein
MSNLHCREDLCVVNTYLFGDFFLSGASTLSATGIISFKKKQTRQSSKKGIYCPGYAIVAPGHYTHWVHPPPSIGGILQNFPPTRFHQHPLWNTSLPIFSKEPKITTNQPQYMASTTSPNMPKYSPKTNQLQTNLSNLTSHLATRNTVIVHPTYAISN